MTQPELETVYEALAQGIDAVGAGQRELYLAMVALALAERLGDAALAADVIDRCRAGLDTPTRQPVPSGQGGRHPFSSP